MINTYATAGLAYLGQAAGTHWKGGSVAHVGIVGEAFGIELGRAVAVSEYLKNGRDLLCRWKKNFIPLTQRCVHVCIITTLRCSSWRSSSATARPARNNRNEAYDKRTPLDCAMVTSKNPLFH